MNRFIKLLAFLILIVIIMPKKKRSRNKPKKGKKRTKKKENFQNIYDEDLEICGTDPMTGYFREGYCTTDNSDHGTHTVCSKMNKEFLDYTKTMGNDLSTPRGSFQGLKPGDNWCLCAIRWKQMFDEHPELTPKVNLNATHKKTLNYIGKDILEKYGY
jgi:uncharacterized protein (DUF2237 family)